MLTFICIHSVVLTTHAIFHQKIHQKTWFVCTLPTPDLLAKRALPFIQCGGLSGKGGEYDADMLDGPQDAFLLQMAVLKLSLCKPMGISFYEKGEEGIGGRV